MLIDSRVVVNGFQLRDRSNLSWGKKKKGDEVEDEDDDDVVRTSVSQGRVTETLRHCVLRNYSSEISIYNSPHICIRLVKQEGREDMDGQHDTLGRPAGSHTSQLDLTAVSRAYDETGSFYTIIL